MREMSREELSEWMAFSQLEPFGSWFQEYLSSVVASVVAEVNRNRKKRGRPFTPREFMQDWGEPDKSKATTDAGMFQLIKTFQESLELQTGKRSPVDLQKPMILDPQGRPAS